MKGERADETTRVHEEDVGRHLSVSFGKVLHHVPAQVLAHHVSEFALLPLLGALVHNRTLYASLTPRTRTAQIAERQ